MSEIGVPPIGADSRFRIGLTEGSDAIVERLIDEAGVLSHPDLPVVGEYLDTADRVEIISSHVDVRTNLDGHDFDRSLRLTRKARRLRFRERFGFFVDKKHGEPETQIEEGIYSEEKSKYMGISDRVIRSRSDTVSWNREVTYQRRRGVEAGVTYSRLRLALFAGLSILGIVAENTDNSLLPSFTTVDVPAFEVPNFFSWETSEAQGAPQTELIGTSTETVIEGFDDPNDGLEPNETARDFPLYFAWARSLDNPEPGLVLTSPEQVDQILTNIEFVIHELGEEPVSMHVTGHASAEDDTEYDAGLLMTDPENSQLASERARVATQILIDRAREQGYSDIVELLENIDLFPGREQYATNDQFALAQNLAAENGLTVQEMVWQYNRGLLGDPELDSQIDQLLDLQQNRYANIRLITRQLDEVTGGEFTESCINYIDYLVSTETNKTRDFGEFDIAGFKLSLIGLAAFLYAARRQITVRKITYSSQTIRGEIVEEARLDDDPRIASKPVARSFNSADRNRLTREDKKFMLVLGGAIVAVVGLGALIGELLPNPQYRSIVAESDKAEVVPDADSCEVVTRYFDDNGNQIANPDVAVQA